MTITKPECFSAANPTDHPVSRLPEPEQGEAGFRALELSFKSLKKRQNALDTTELEIRSCQMWTPNIDAVWQARRDQLCDEIVEIAQRAANTAAGHCRQLAVKSQILREICEEKSTDPVQNLAISICFDIERLIRGAV